MTQECDEYVQRLPLRGGVITLLWSVGWADGGELHFGFDLLIYVDATRCLRFLSKLLGFCVGSGVRGTGRLRKGPWK